MPRKKNKEHIAVSKSIIETATRVLNKVPLKERFEHFLVELEDTGDVAKACDATGLSLKAVNFRRRKDADFDAGWELALTRSGALGAYQTFLDVYAKTGNMSEALKLSGISRADVVSRMRDDPEFAEVFNHAKEEATDALEGEARRRAYHGVARPIVQSGKIVYHLDANGNVLCDELGAPIPVMNVEFSDKLLEVLLKANRPEKYRENIKVDHAVSGGVLMLTGKIAPTDEEWEKNMERKRLDAARKVIEHEPRAN